jgi:hypothetical protein
MVMVLLFFEFQEMLLAGAPYSLRPVARKRSRDLV